MLRTSLFLRCVPPLSAVYGKSFSVTPRVWRRISEKNAEEGYGNDLRYLRLMIESGGCHGYAYKFLFEENSELVADEDVVVAESDVVQLPQPKSQELRTVAEGEGEGDVGESKAKGPPPRLVVDKHSVAKLLSAVVDFHSELKGSAFVVIGNELVDKSCACAMSFSMKKQQQKV
ncbi:Iron-sulfur assembly protein 2 [Trypanosoma equiperdum]|uniref:Iron-sulfur assembly protein 2 n=4 Tax=Trypanozoon TaxID=39700 RepID=Q57W48_TRYB2|nr:hypothetical protein, conserved [Trypanosoma brucei gambiense DAL972]XP_844777.1 hypothetical protein, conserved [Trypanosoma brucei brucei TREU927]AAX70171.1 hypothetical protein, conserved [Trypanosoma brucei]RHW72404.1 Iron-sulfur assembly protein 2 [Trypanosoma brucei equiperdum]SCU64866.1 Iron-sulfur assembly protein 2 [Trypanosoma equiperdum]AAZ11218.1 hypothetical protein, conserved [Trypanosoma brucei brucei TREU927]CBH11002.1 hypothetical protein, conserved [Trypanosoma brucei gam|eukprot:XP_011773289.1 hypothetical protein, conserved [Trypanosoma brucei gambiense DAL972]